MPKIVRFHETGGPEVLKIDDLPLAQPGEGEVRLNVEAIGLNRAEVMFRQGRYLDAPELPSRLGYEAAGLVDAVGPGASDIEDLEWGLEQIKAGRITPLLDRALPLSEAAEAHRLIANNEITGNIVLLPWAE